MCPFSYEVSIPSWEVRDIMWCVGVGNFKSLEEGKNINLWLVSTFPPRTKVQNISNTLFFGASMGNQMDPVQQSISSTSSWILARLHNTKWIHVVIKLSKKTNISDNCSFSWKTAKSYLVLHFLISLFFFLFKYLHFPSLRTSFVVHRCLHICHLYFRRGRAVFPDFISMSLPEWMTSKNNRFPKIKKISQKHFFQDKHFNV